MLLNLSKGFDPFRSLSVNEIKYESFIFNGGEPHIRIKTSHNLYETNHVTITHRINNFEDLGLLLVAVNALRNLTSIGFSLVLPYFPGARQDRIMVPGEPLTVKLYADIINSLKFTSVEILDPHSEVTPALLNNCAVLNNHAFVTLALDQIYPKNFFKPFCIVSPDSGANKKMKDLLVFLNQQETIIPLVKCDKTRDVVNGIITGFEVYADYLEGKDCIIVDDICDGGGTFMGLATELKAKGAGDLYLIVSHGIFSKGFKELKKHFKGIYTTDSIVKIGRAHV